MTVIVSQSVSCGSKRALARLGRLADGILPIYTHTTYIRGTAAAAATASSSRRSPIWCRIYRSSTTTAYVVFHNDARFWYSSDPIFFFSAPFFVFFLFFLLLPEMTNYLKRPGHFIKRWHNMAIYFFTKEDIQTDHLNQFISPSEWCSPTDQDDLVGSCYPSISISSWHVESLDNFF